MSQENNGSPACHSLRRRRQRALGHPPPVGRTLVHRPSQTFPEWRGRMCRCARDQPRRSGQDMPDAAVLRRFVCAPIHDEHAVIRGQRFEDEQPTSRRHPRQGHRRLLPPQIEVVVPEIGQVSGRFRQRHAVTRCVPREHHRGRETNVEHKALNPQRRYSAVSPARGANAGIPVKDTADNARPDWMNCLRLATTHPHHVRREERSRADLGACRAKQW